MEDSIRTWLLAGDPAIRWQVLRDPREQRRIAKEGWGAQFLQHQDPDGRWAHGIYNPKWTSTTYTLVLLRSLGLEPAHPRRPGRRPRTPEGHPRLPHPPGYGLLARLRHQLLPPPL